MILYKKETKNELVARPVIFTPLHNLTIWRCVVSNVCPIRQRGVGYPVWLDHPVVIVELDKLDRVWLDVDTKVDEVAEGVNPSQDQNDYSCELVQVDVVVEGEDGAEPEVAYPGQRVSEHQDQHHRGREIQTST